MNITWSSDPEQVEKDLKIAHDNELRTTFAFAVIIAISIEHVINTKTSEKYEYFAKIECQSSYEMTQWRISFLRSARFVITLHRRDGPAVSLYQHLPNFNKILKFIKTLRALTDELDFPCPPGDLVQKEWYIEGVPHREDGPAKIFNDIARNRTHHTWFLNGKKHRLDGPAFSVTKQDGYFIMREWYVNDKLLQEFDLCGGQANYLIEYIKNTKQKAEVISICRLLKWIPDHVLNALDAGCVFS